MIEALKIHVKGIVQGVGFRPFVYRLAKRYLINGWVLNAADGVFIHAEGESKLLDEFIMEISDNAPEAAQVTEIEMKEVPLEDFKTFEIRFSDESAVEKTTLVSPDLAVCDECVAELFDSADRRYRYPFINCTNCGPRFTIIDALPYDRKSTSMKSFEMCPTCAAEYADPADRRFHAQPDACFECGPCVTWYELGARAEEEGALARAEGMRASERAMSDAVFARAVAYLREGGILAVKGLGGFHLVCDANNAEAVAQLRARKQRDGKPFAVMMENLEAVRAVCEVNDAEARVLQSAQRPIVLLRKRSDATFVPGLADDLTELGVMLPYTPVQHLLMRDFADGALLPMLVMTSGNMHDEPIVVSDEEALAKLGKVADAVLGNDRDILTRFDDSVVRVIKAGAEGFAVQFIRRARGYAPQPIKLPGMDVGAAGAGGEAPCILATGPEQKNTFTLLRGDEAFVSQHIGDMENAPVYDAWLATKRRYEQLFEAAPQLVACDLHPEYLTTKWALDSQANALPVAQMQHHHAHIVSVMAEHGLHDAVCGIAFDGTGYGVDGSIWGGEVLLSNRVAFERFINFAYSPMPGGAAAVKKPLRMAYGVLWNYDLLDHPGAQAALEQLGAQASLCDQMIEKGINTPMTSSVGRLFDAASALLGVCIEPKYEGEGAILLEAAAASAPEFDPADGVDEKARSRYAVSVVKNVATEHSTAQDASVLLFDAETTFSALLDDLEAGVSVPVIARRFHDAFVDAVVMAAQLVEAMYGITTVVLAGGVFMNRYLIEHVLDALEVAGFTVAINRDLPPNDGSISLGQAAHCSALRSNGACEGGSC